MCYQIVKMLNLVWVKPVCKPNLGQGHQFATSDLCSLSSTFLCEDLSSLCQTLEYLQGPSSLSSSGLPVSLGQCGKGHHSQRTLVFPWLQDASQHQRRSICEELRAHHNMLLAYNKSGEGEGYYFFSFVLSVNIYRAPTVFLYWGIVVTKTDTVPVSWSLREHSYGSSGFPSRPRRYSTRQSTLEAAVASKYKKLGLREPAAQSHLCSCHSPGKENTQML